MSEKTIVCVLAAGLGTRMKSERAKVLHEVAGRPLIHWAVEAALTGGAARVLTILGHQREAVEAALAARYGAGKVETVFQAEQRGTGHAVACALPALESESESAIVVITSGDAPLIGGRRIAELVGACRNSTSGLSLLSMVPARDSSYGRLVRAADGTLERIVEFADASEEQRAITEMNAGFYAIRLGQLRHGLQTLRADNAKGELYLTDLVALAHARGGARVIEVPYAEVVGINDRVDLAAVDAFARQQINEGLMRQGVTMLSPASVFIDADVGPIGHDVVIGPGVILRGKTSIAAGAMLDAGCVLTDVEVGPGTHIKPYSVLTETIVGATAEIGPFTHCRPGTRVDEDVRLGNFVETKKTHLMAGAKASHLSYLGDASIGTGANIGAGTITCNYDGFKKHKTVVEAGAFIGSDSQLVAPVTVGRGAYVGAGSTIVRDVPRSSLALSRSKQVNVEDWADRFREANEKRKQRSDK